LELALIGTLLTHITSGVLRMRTRRGTKAQPALRLRLHRYAGYFLAIFVFGHIGATRVPVALGVVGVSAPRVIRKGPGFWAPVSIGIGVIVAALLAFGGVLFEIADPFDNEFARAYEASAAFVSGNGS